MFYLFIFFLSSRPMFSSSLPTLMVPQFLRPGSFCIWPVHGSVTLSHNEVPHWAEPDRCLPSPWARVNHQPCIISDSGPSTYPRLDESKGRRRRRRHKRGAIIRRTEWGMSSIRSEGRKKEKNWWRQWRRNVEGQAAALTRSVMCHYIWRKWKSESLL